MEELNKNPILEFNENQLQAVRQAHGYEDVNKLKQDIELLKEWIQKQNHFKIKDFDPGYLERLLIYNKGSIERTKQRFDKFCTFINLMPDFLQNFDIKNEFRPLLSMGNIAVLPKPTSDNYRVIISQTNGSCDNDFQLIDYYRYHVVIAHHALCNDYCHGFVVIFDARNLTLNLVTKCNPITINKGLMLLVEAMGMRLKKIHLISGSKLFDTFLMIVKQGLSEKLRNRLMVHSTVEGLQDYIPREQLPVDFGGDERSVKELNDMNFEEWSSDSHIANVKFMESAATDESSRLVCKFNEEYSGMPGSFKTLCVD
ncbi:unnamed protein product [Arctia plantaginis]|uniref:CRAL-TRIO domain-containing protein n=1 Tax=Arctia plantaginis TaxID=874455 RepID=A0A8S0YS98_ARCPL|nr:unnamed protein product [Arctia plantaginis]